MEKQTKDLIDCSMLNVYHWLRIFEYACHWCRIFYRRTLAIGAEYFTGEATFEVSTFCFSQQSIKYKQQMTKNKRSSCGSSTVSFDSPPRTKPRLADRLLAIKAASPQPKNRINDNLEQFLDCIDNPPSENIIGERGVLLWFEMGVGNRSSMMDLYLMDSDEDRTETNIAENLSMTRDEPDNHVKKSLMQQLRKVTIFDVPTTYIYLQAGMMVTISRATGRKSQAQFMPCCNANYAAIEATEME